MLNLLTQQFELDVGICHFLIRTSSDSNRKSAVIAIIHSQTDYCRPVYSPGIVGSGVEISEMMRYPEVQRTFSWNFNRLRIDQVGAFKCGSYTLRIGPLVLRQAVRYCQQIRKVILCRAQD